MGGGGERTNVQREGLGRGLMLRLQIFTVFQDWKEGNVLFKSVLIYCRVFYINNQCHIFLLIRLQIFEYFFSSTI